VENFKAQKWAKEVGMKGNKLFRVDTLGRLWQLGGEARFSRGENLWEKRFQITEPKDFIVNTEDYESPWWKIYGFDSFMGTVEFNEEDILGKEVIEECIKDGNGYVLLGKKKREIIYVKKIKIL